MAYRDDITALSPDHLWRFDGDDTDSVGALNGSQTGIATGPAITEDATGSRQSNGTGDRISVATAATVDQALTRKFIGGWVQVTAIQPPPKSIYREGTTNNQLCLVCWAGNALMLDIVNSGVVTQVLGTRVLTPGRVFHLGVSWSGTGFDDEVVLYLDGVVQGTTTAGAATLAARTAAEWSDPSSTTEVGNQTVLLNGLVNCNYAYWASWGNKTLPTPTQIREELFEKGAVPGVTIVSGTQAAMQSALDVLASTARPDEPLNIRVEAVSGGGDFTLTADNITHDALASIHVQYTGTDTLTWVNNNGSNASIGSTPNGGTLNIVTPATLTVEPLIAGSEIVVSTAGSQTELASNENTGTSFAVSLQASSVDIRIHKDDYEFIKVSSVDMTQGDVLVPVSQVFDLNYENP